MASSDRVAHRDSRIELRRCRVSKSQSISACAEAWACVASLIETCRLNAVDPEAWLADVLERLVGGWPMGGIDELMPWAPAFKNAGAAEQERCAA